MLLGLVKEVLIEDLSNLSASVQDAVRSKTYIYPFEVRIVPEPVVGKQRNTQKKQLTPNQGIFYLTTHETLQEPLRKLATKTLTTGLGVTAFMFIFTYVPQTAILTLTNGPAVAPISGALLVLSESSSVTAWIAGTFLSVRKGLVDVFDETLATRGKEELLHADGDTADEDADADGDGDAKPQRKLTKEEKIQRRKDRFVEQSRSMFSFLEPKSLVRSVLYFPLNFVPVVGTALYVALQGIRAGPVAHERYFWLKGFNRKEREGKKREWIMRRRGGYMG